AEAEAMRDLRTALLLSRAGTPPQVVLVSSSSVGEGKTTVSMNLAIVFAKRGKTCLVEGDLRRPSIARTLGIRGELGLSHHLAGSAQLESVIVEAPGISGLSIIPAGHVPPNPADLMASEQMQSMIESLRGSFDHIVVDSPPVIPFSDARVLSSLAD